LVDQRVLERKVRIDVISVTAPVSYAGDVTRLLEVGQDSERTSPADLGSAFDLGDRRFWIARNGQQDLRVIR
jgi:hypothetical protein